MCFVVRTSRSMVMIIVVMISLLCASSSFASFEGSYRFDVPGNLQQRVDFWVNIFTRWHDQVYVIHDRRHPWRVIDFVFFDRLAERTQDSRYLIKKVQSEKLQQLMQRYELALQRFAEDGKDALSVGVFERRLFRSYQDSRDALEDLLSGQVRLRVQKGLASSFLIAARRAQNYLPYFEKEFRSVGVPIALTRIAFVESMFNPSAVSKVGASGMWQFMPATAKHFMLVNRRLDERHSPFKAARAAAKMLKNDYKSLKSWPLAVTAYNHGRGGVLRASRTVGTSDLSKIIQGYADKRAFGFASQNFYAEFLAAVKSYELLVERRQLSIVPSSWDIEVVHLQQPTRIKDLEKVLGIPQQMIQDFNPCIKENTFENHTLYRLPSRYRLYVPKHASHLTASYVRNL